MPRKKEDKIRFSTIIDQEVNDKLHKHSEKSGLPIAFIVNKALKIYLGMDENEKNNSSVKESEQI